MTTIEALRRWLLAILVLGLTGTGLELMLIEHYEDSWQIVPIGLIALALAALTWHHLKHDAVSLRAIRMTMVLFIAAGLLGVGLHIRGASEFQLEIDRTLGWWQLSKKVMRAKAPPALAPGLMCQLGLLGLAYTYRYPYSHMERS